MEPLFPTHVIFSNITVNEALTLVSDFLSQGHTREAKNAIEVIRKHLSVNHSEALRSQITQSSDVELITKELMMFCRQSSTETIHRLIELGITPEDFYLYRSPLEKLTSIQRKKHRVALYLRAIFIYHAARAYDPASDLLWKFFKCKVYNPLHKNSISK